MSSSCLNEIKVLVVIADGKAIDKASAIRSKHSVTEQRRRSKINERYVLCATLIDKSVLYCVHCSSVSCLKTNNNKNIAYYCNLWFKIE